MLRQGKTGWSRSGGRSAQTQTRNSSGDIGPKWLILCTLWSLGVMSWNNQVPYPESQYSSWAYLTSPGVAWRLFAMRCHCVYSNLDIAALSGRALIHPRPHAQARLCPESQQERTSKRTPAASRDDSYSSLGRRRPVHVQKRKSWPARGGTWSISILAGRILCFLQLSSIDPGIAEIETPLPSITQMTRIGRTAATLQRNALDSRANFRITATLGCLDHSGPTQVATRT